MLLIELAREQIRQHAQDQGFYSVSFIPSQEATRFPALCDWLDRGLAASMQYLQKRRDAYRNPQSVLPGCQSLVMLTLPYQGHRWTGSVERQGRHRTISNSGHSTIGSYAAPKEDYHSWIRRQLKPLIKELHRMFPNQQTRAVVDTTPLLERNFAELAGVGWIGKNTMLLSRDLGSYFFICAILTEVPFHEAAESISEPARATAHCGTCTACLDACPTQAFIEPYVLDANRCISYWTIEHRGQVPEKMRKQIGPWLFGCDVCQIVCPWNRKIRVDIHQDMQPVSLDRKTDCLHWLTIDQQQFDLLYKATPFARTGLEGMQRNALIVAANLQLLDAIPRIKVFMKHQDPDLSSLAQWAYEQFTQD